MKTSDQINELSVALAKAQGQIANAKKDTENPFFKSMYADLSACWDVCRTPLSSNGLSLAQSLVKNDLGLFLTCRLMHSSGQWIEGDVPLLLSKQDMQGLGSAMTYARRYSLAAMVGIAQEDDDANAVCTNNTIVSKNDTGGTFLPGWPGTFPIPLKLKKKVLTVGELSAFDIQNDISYWYGRAEKERKPLTGDIAAYVEALEAMKSPGFESDVP